MNEVRHIVARMMEDPAPPPRSPDEVLMVARRANHRRSMFAAAGSGALVLLLVAAIGLAVRSLQHRAPTAPPSVIDVAGPQVQAAPAHGEVMAQRIVAALPDGLAVDAIETFGDETAPVSVAVGDTVQILAAAVVQVTDGDGHGEVFAYLVADGGSGDDASVACDEADRVLPVLCDLAQVNGVPLRVVTSRELARGLRIEVTRFLPGGWLVVGAWQGLAMAADVTQVSEFTPSWYRQPLAEPIDIEVLTALAADPAMLPA